MSNIVDLTDSNMSEDTDSENESKEFIATVENIERYMVDNQVTLTGMDPSTVDIFDITMTGELRTKIKCLLHPSINKYIYKGLLATKSMIHVKDFDFHYNDTELLPDKIIILKEIEVLEFQASGDIQSHKIKILRKQGAKDKPLTTSRNYYLPLYCDEDYYGINWKNMTSPLKKVSIRDVSSVVTIQAIATSGCTIRNPVYGTIISKSKLKHFGKTDDSKGKYPYTFCIEIENNGWTCCVSFWNNACFSYFRRINVGDNILVRNYRTKKRYVMRSNTVYKGQDSNVELSINSANPEGIIESLQEEPCTVPYRFKTCSTLNKLPSKTDTILDVVGIITFIGRWKREKKLKSAGKCCQDFWMFRWIVLNDFTSKFNMKLKLYSCSQSEVLENLSIGEIFIGSRLLYHLTIHKENKTPKFSFYLTTTRESQLYHLSKDWTLDDIKTLPFRKYPTVLDILKTSKDGEQMAHMLEGCHTGGHFNYLTLPHTLQDYEILFTPENPIEIISPQNFVRLVEDMHIYQSIRSVCVQANIAAVEIVEEPNDSKPPKKRKRRNRRKNKSEETSSSSEGDYPLFIVDEVSIERADAMERVGDINITDETKNNFLGSYTDIKNCKQKSFLRILLTGLNKNVAILATFLPHFNKQPVSTSSDRNFIEVLSGLTVPDNYFGDTKKLLKDIEIIKCDDRFLFVLDLYYFGNNVHEVTINRAFPL